MIQIGQASHDENGKYSAGEAGDQTGEEVLIRDWYSRPWNVVLRPKTKELADRLVANMTAACKNNCIGYDQGGRLSAYYRAAETGWNISAIKTPCETDCSALVALCCICAGLNVDPDLYTGTEKNQLKETGMFDVLTDNKYLTSGDYLKAGDVLLLEYHHTAMALEDGEKARETDPQENLQEYKIGTGASGLTVTASVLNVRNYPETGAVTEQIALRETVIPSEKAKVNGTWWYHISGGWVCAKYLTGWIQEEDGRWWWLDPGYKWPAGEFRTIGGKVYHFDDSGWCDIGKWFKDGTGEYYADATGVKATSCYVKSTQKEWYYWLDADGVWQTSGDTATPDLTKYKAVV